jgi:microcystin-dependent protein
MPSHGHFLNADTGAANTNNPDGRAYAVGGWSAPPNSGVVGIYTTAAPDTALGFNAINVAGGSLPHNNLMPYLMLNFCIALQGIFPPRG